MAGAGKAYSPLAKTLHWLTAAAVFIAIPLGLWLPHAGPGMMDTLYRNHWSFGLLALAIGLVRLTNRLLGGVAAPFPGLTRLEAVLSAIVHRALYLLLLAVPLVGWAGKSAYGGAITVFGLFDAPPLLAQDTPLGERLLGLHGLLAWLFILCIVLHISGALLRRRHVLRRMLPGREP